MFAVFEVEDRDMTIKSQIPLSIGDCLDNGKRMVEVERVGTSYIFVRDCLNEQTETIPVRELGSGWWPVTVRKEHRC